MLNITKKIDANGKAYLETDIYGKALLTIPQLNKGTAFTMAERHAFNLLGKLPDQVETLNDQVARAYHQFLSYDEPINRNIFLNHIANTNQILFYKLISEHLEEMLPTIYTPIVGNAVEQFHKKFLQPRGIYISYGDLAYIDEILDNRSNKKIELIVISDGEGVLGIGDQGVGAMMIPIAKLMVYTAIGKINPSHTLPIMLDAGTNNKDLLDSPFYLGWRHPRISGKQYNEFIDTVIDTIKRKLPDVFLHWEDFGKINADRNLKVHREKICSFNDDIQGTGVVAVAAILAALRRSKQNMQDQRIVIFGAGAAGMGITDQIYKNLRRLGLSDTQAQQQFYLMGRNGLITEHTADIHHSQQPYVRSANEVATWDVVDINKIDLLEVVRHVKPTILIGCSAQPGAFNEAIIKEMAQHVEHPIIFPLSNPTERSEACPQDLIKWTDGRALVATGSPFAPVTYNGKTYTISQCNNFLAFPGLGLGILAVKATHVSDDMLWAASTALSDYTHDSKHTLLPSISQSIEASRLVAIKVAQAAQAGGLAKINRDTSIEALVDKTCWNPHYLPYKLIK